MGDFSVKAILSAVDKNFTSTMKDALGSTNSLKDTIKSGLGFGMLMGAGQAAFSKISSEAVGLTKETINTSDSMQKLQQSMRFSGYAESEIQRIAGATGTLKTYADKTVFALEDVMSTYGALSANGIKNADKMTQAVGNAIAVYGGGAQEFKSIGLAYSQAMASGALHAQDWNQILNASPQLAGGLRKELIRLNPAIGKDFKGSMEKGAISADLLGQAMNNIGMTDLAKEAAQSVTTFEGAMGNLEATAQSGMLELYDTFAKTKVIDAINKLNTKTSSGFSWLSTNIPAFISKVSPYWKVFKTDVIEVKNAFGDAASAIVREVGELSGAFGSADSVENFSDVLGIATGALTTFAGFMQDHADIIAKVITILPELYIAYQGFKIVKKVVPFVGAFTGAIGGLAKMGLSRLAPNLFKVSEGQDAVGNSSGRSSKKMIASAKAFMMMAVGVLAVSAGMYLLAQSAIGLANAGPLAIAVMVGMVGAVAALGYGMVTAVNSMTGSANKLRAISTVFMAVGASILMISAGFWILSNASISLANAGPLAIATMAGMVVALGALLFVAQAVAPALTAGAAGFIAFGVAILLVATGALLASKALEVVASALPSIASYGMQGAAAITMLGVSMIVFAGGTMMAGAAFVVFGAGLAVASVGIVAFGVGVTAASVGVLAMAVALKATNSSMKSIAKNAKTAQKSITSMKSSVNIVNDGLSALGDKGKSAMNQLASAFDSSASKAKSSGKKVGTGFTSGMKSGLNSAPSIAKSAVNKSVSALAAGRGRAYNAGAYIGQGFALGMRSKLGEIRRTAAQMASAADAAIRAEARIHSPSKVSEEDGAYWGEGWVCGILSKMKDARKAAREFVMTPMHEMANMPDFAFAGGYGGMELSEKYMYGHSGTYTIVVPLDVDGRELAKATATYTQEELDKNEKRNNRKGGRR